MTRTPIRRVTIKDIAREAGVSLATVSRALNDKPDISDGTKARIHALAQEMGYVPSAIARSLVTQRTRTIGLAVRTISDLWVAEIVPAIESVAREANYEVFLSCHYATAKLEKRVVETFRNRQVDGIIIVSSIASDEYRSLQTEWNVPIVLIAPLLDTTHYYTVRADGVKGARLATDHLIALGHRRIGYIGVPSWVACGQRRLDGYRHALLAQDIPYDPCLVVLGDAHEQGGLEGMQLLMTLPQPPTAVFCFNDLTAIGALRGARLRNVRVPENVSLVGFDDVPLAQHIDPPLTTIRQDMGEIGCRACQMLLDLMAGHDPVAPLLLETRLVVRESSDRA